MILFLGNIITGVFWKAHGDRSGDPRIMGHTMAWLPILRTPWILQSLVLFLISGAAFMAQVAPLQVRLRALAAAGAAGGSWDQAAYRHLSRRWELWGAVAAVTPLLAVVLMVTKPGG